MVVLNIQRVLSRISFLRGRRITLTEFSKVCGVSRAVISRAANPQRPSGGFTSTTVNRILHGAMLEIRRHIDADRISDEELKESLLSELFSTEERRRFLSKRQMNAEAKRKKKALQDFPYFCGDHGDVTDGEQEA